MLLNILLKFLFIFAVILHVCKYMEKHVNVSK